MKNQIALLATIGIVFLFIIGLNLESPTGFITGNYAKTVNSHVTDFFSITGIAFPPNECGKIVKELYDDFAFVPTDTTVGFESSGVKTLNFVVDRIFFEQNPIAPTFARHGLLFHRLPRRGRLFVFSIDNRTSFCRFGSWLFRCCASENSKL